MSRDFELKTDARDHEVNPVFNVVAGRMTSEAAIFADPLFLLLVFGFGRAARRRRE